MRYLRGAPAALLLISGLPAQEPSTLSLLTIGNSFAGNATFFLRQICESQGIRMAIHPANLGGCDLARHARHLRAYRHDPGGPGSRPYKDPASPDKGNYGLVDALKSADPDFVTLQQFSGDSFKPETYEPYAGELIEAVRQYAPRARILVHQTWAYRADHPFFQDGALTQEKMFEGLRDAYDKLAASYSLSVLPVGEAFQIARSTAMWRFVYPDPDFNYGAPPPGALPRQQGSLITGWFWRVDRKTNARQLALDAKHANTAGRYLAACVFYEGLTGRSALGISWRPEGLTEAQAESLRQSAHLAVFARREAPALRRPPAAGLPSPLAGHLSWYFSSIDAP